MMTEFKPGSVSVFADVHMTRWTAADLVIGKRFCLGENKRIHICKGNCQNRKFVIRCCDKRTRDYYRDRGRPQQADLDWPEKSVANVPSHESDLKNFCAQTKEFKHNLANQVLTIAVVENIDPKKATKACAFLRDQNFELFMSIESNSTKKSAETFLQSISKKL